MPRNYVHVKLIEKEIHEKAAYCYSTGSIHKQKLCLQKFSEKPIEKAVLTKPACIIKPFKNHQFNPASL
ncbi:hypothetical protein [Faecalispora anaeroviscerum]|uniref:hypothetical protein n=1 Tax=Faecalispora anaeroviscerum TaxID=2991836 RepID=UPI0024B92741|nr:hypothetical protein [Faecalispora anaeroviscerum]